MMEITAAKKNVEDCEDTNCFILSCPHNYSVATKNYKIASNT